MKTLNSIKRQIKYFYQKVTRGFSDKDTYDLTYTISKFILPRLKRYNEFPDIYPPQLFGKKWYKILNDMIYAFEQIVKERNDGIGKYSKERQDRIKEGLRLFAKYFQFLWCDEGK